MTAKAPFDPIDDSQGERIGFPSGSLPWWVLGDPLGKERGVPGGACIGGGSRQVVEVVQVVEDQRRPILATPVGARRRQGGAQIRGTHADRRAMVLAGRTPSRTRKLVDAGGRRPSANGACAMPPQAIGDLYWFQVADCVVNTRDMRKLHDQWASAKRAVCALRGAISAHCKVTTVGCAGRAGVSLSGWR